MKSKGHGEALTHTTRDPEQHTHERSHAPTHSSPLGALIMEPFSRIYSRVILILILSSPATSCPISKMEDSNISLMKEDVTCVSSLGRYGHF